MERFLFFFEHLSFLFKGVWIVFFISFFWIIEGYYSFYKSKFNKWNHAKTNLLLLGLVIIINALFGILLTLIDVWLKKSDFGILNTIHANLWVKVVISIVVFRFYLTIFCSFFYYIK